MWGSRDDISTQSRRNERVVIGTRDHAPSDSLFYVHFLELDKESRTGQGPSAHATSGAKASIPIVSGLAQKKKTSLDEATSLDGTIRLLVLRHIGSGFTFPWYAGWMATQYDAAI